MKSKWVSYLLARIAKYAIKGILLTCRVRVHGIDSFAKTASQGKCILMLWHSRLTLVAEIMTRHAPQFKYAALISNSRDADILASHTNSYGIGRAFRVPHNARAQVLKMMVKQLKNGNEVIIITPDGPRGPAKEVKPGVAYAAKMAAASVVPFSWDASRVWRFKTWDQLMLPKPFSTITVTLGAPLSIKDESEIPKLKKSLDSLEITSN